jgi:hypothetical protein
MHQLLVELVDDAAIMVGLGLRNRNGMRSLQLAGGYRTRHESPWNVHPAIAAISAGSDSKENGSYCSQAAPAAEAARSSIGRGALRKDALDHDNLLVVLCEEDGRLPLHCDFDL